MSTREFRWIEGDSKGGARMKMYAQAVAGKRHADIHDEACLHSVIYHLSTNKFEVEYWRLDNEEGFSVGSSAYMMEGDWVDLCACDTFEDAMTAAENALRLNLGGWP